MPTANAPTTVTGIDKAFERQRRERIKLLRKRQLEHRHIPQLDSIRHTCSGRPASQIIQKRLVRIDGSDLDPWLTSQR